MSQRVMAVDCFYTGCTLKCLHGVRVRWCSLLYEIEDLDGVGHPEEDGLQVWDQIRDTEK